MFSGSSTHKRHRPHISRASPMEGARHSSNATMTKDRFEFAAVLSQNSGILSRRGKYAGQHSSSTGAEEEWLRQQNQRRGLNTPTPDAPFNSKDALPVASCPLVEWIAVTSNDLWRARSSLILRRILVRGNSG